MIFESNKINDEFHNTKTTVTMLDKTPNNTEMTVTALKTPLTTLLRPREH